MKEVFRYLLTASLFLIISCNKEPQPINYGSDACDFCRMTISDKKFGCEVISKKGKAYKFDSIECMVDYLHANAFIQDQLTRILVSNYSGANGFLEAASAVYLESENLKSPMAKGLSAFEKMDEMESIRQQYGGQTYNWQELLSRTSGNTL